MAYARASLVLKRTAPKQEKRANDTDFRLSLETSLNERFSRAKLGKCLWYTHVLDWFPCKRSNFRIALKKELLLNVGSRASIRRLYNFRIALKKERGLIKFYNKYK